MSTYIVDCGFSSGGGFAYQTSQPFYLTDAVDGYFSSGMDPYPGYEMYGIYGDDGYSNRNVGRGVPDIAFLGVDYTTFVGGIPANVGGTSASAPVFAAMVSLVNNIRLSKGLGTLGWINPSLYKYYYQFTNDVTSGNNLCSESICCPQGFYAAEGW